MGMAFIKEILNEIFFRCNIQSILGNLLVSCQIVPDCFCELQPQEVTDLIVAFR